ncbi:hypothetical protein ZIOFF_040220 [Zingiber officinale]|uniref:Ribulose bisphosphate carboxylase small subunit, chloroplastic n=1 Tax=Zingiber officinale TaxID=94328 RepID=A0A8J5G2M4_ZINOF|nr:hypothetical protein ZIOFF_040220 [Zingiber officinale]
MKGLCDVTFGFHHHDGLLRHRQATSSVQSNMVAPFSGLKPLADAPFLQKANADLSHLLGNSCRVQCMKGVKKFETLSYLPPLPEEALLKQIEYLLRSNWTPRLEFSKGVVGRENHQSPGYYDGRYWTMWKLPMFRCNEASQVAKELEKCKKEYPDTFIRIIGFDNNRQVQCVSFIAYKPS